MGDSTAVAAEEQRIQEACFEWLSGLQTERSGTGKYKRKARKIHRVKAYKWILEVDNALRGVSGLGIGLKHFVVPADWREESAARPLDWPVLILSSDQGPDGWCAMSFLESPHVGLNIVREPDSHNHGVHNDTIGACLDMGWGPFLYGMTVVLNLSFLPWGDGKFGGIVRGGHAEMLEASNHTERTFQNYLVQIAKEKDMETELYTGAAAEEAIFASFLNSEVFNKSHQKVGLCRWYQLFVRLRSFMVDWHSLIVVLLRVLIAEKFLEHLVTTTMGSESKDGVLKQTESGGSVPTKKSSAEEVRALRSACKNAMELTLALLLDNMNRVRGFLLEERTRPVHEWYAKQAKEVRSATASLAWHLEQLGGGWIEPLRRTLDCLSNAEFLARVGLRTSKRALSERVDAQHALLKEEQQVSSMCGEFVFRLIYRRVVREAWFTSGYPSVFALLIMPETRAAALHRLRKDYELFQEARSKDDAVLRKVVARSPFQLPCVMQVLSHLRLQEWVVDTALVEHLRKRCMALKQSRVVEDGFLTQKRQEEKSRNKYVSPLKVYNTLVEKKIVDAKYTVATCLPSTRDSGPWRTHASSPKAKECSIDATKVKGPSARPDWQTASPNLWARSAIDLSLLRFLTERDAWCETSDMWIAGLWPRRDPLVVQLNENDWGVTLGVHDGIALLVWRCELREDSIDLMKHTHFIQNPWCYEKVFEQYMFVMEDIFSLHLMLENENVFDHQWVDPKLRADRIRVKKTILVKEHITLYNELVSFAAKRVHVLMSESTHAEMKSEH
eukprot:6465886-Amphidinium_carterae.1